MNIIEKNYKWNGTLTKRKSTKYIVIHHMAGFGNADDVHKMHIGRGWTGIGYNFLVRRDGSVYRGRPIDTVGAHTEGSNSVSVGVCFEGNYHDKNDIPEVQKKAGKELVAYLKGLYPTATVKKHGDLQATACPGQYFPFAEIAGVKATTAAPTKTTTNKTENKGDEIVITLNTLSKGAEGKQVKTLQRLLIAMGHSCGASGADGDFGSATLASVKDFQAKNGLSIDGIVGAKTWNALLK